MVGPSTSACCHSLGEREGVGLHVHRQELHQWPDGSQHQKREGSTPAITLASGSQLPQQQQEHQQQQKQPQEAWGHEVLAPLGILALPLSRSRDNVQVTLSAPCPVLCLNCMQNWGNRALLLSRSRDNVQVTLSAPCPVLCLNCMQNWGNRALPLLWSRDNVQVTLSSRCPTLLSKSVCVWRISFGILPLLLTRSRNNVQVMHQFIGAVLHCMPLRQPGSATVEEQRQCSGDPLITLSNAVIKKCVCGLSLSASCPCC